ncbi:tail fiber protein [Dactylosporangium fulvum]|uniref:Tail fiber protein n=1 Tax=Dactylosporangium fulvum TaxID=53359 RepID=A0ABY5WCR3_9ACTN|nr:tail fiber protein [Dactylosporangium fulvum]UWP87210.1 tail fiber protein [Dactylosporangium fulvum]
MSEPYVGEIRMMAFGFPPRHWALCDGQLLPITQNVALFSILGTTYGGNGQTTFALPDLRGRRPVHVGTAYNLGQTGGAETHTLGLAELPVHTHVPRATATGGQHTPTGAVWAPMPGGYAPTPDTHMAAESVAVVGNGQSHENMPPFLTVNFVIALQGIFPSRPQESP